MFKLTANDVLGTTSEPDALPEPVFPVGADVLPLEKVIPLLALLPLSMIPASSPLLQVLIPSLCFARTFL